MVLIVSIKKNDFKFIKNSILNQLPSAKVIFIIGGGKHYKKIVVEHKGRIFKAPLSCSPGDINWTKSAVSQMLKKLSM